MSKVFVGGLAITVSNDDLGHHFSRYGTVTDVVAMRQRGFGFVEFAESFAGQAAVDDGPHVLHGKDTSVKLAETRETMAEVQASAGDEARSGGGNSKSLPNKLFVGGLPRHVDTRQLEEYFSTYGSLSDAVVMGDRGFGFVAFHDREAMERALDQDHFFDGQQFSVKMADGQRPTRPRGGGCGSFGGFGTGGGPWAGAFGTNKVFVGGIPKDMSTPELREFFSWYGPLVDAVAMDGRGFGFVEFCDQMGVGNAMRDASNINIRGHKCSLKLADGKKTQTGGNYGPAAWAADWSCSGGKGHKGGGAVRKLFVGGLPGDMSDEDLAAHFASYGSITDAKVMAGRGFGFVTFASHESVQTMLRDRHHINGTPLTVKPADGKGGPGGKGSSPY